MTPSARYFERAAGQKYGRLSEIIALQNGVIDNNIHLIASACYPFPSVLNALSQPSTLLPVEGMPGARYLPGAQVMDIVENEGEERVLKLFGVPSGYRATLQPHSGTQANQIAFNSVLEVDDEVLCLLPNNGGHISHTVLISRRHRTINYQLDQDGSLDYQNLADLAKSHCPKLIIVGGSSLPRSIDFEKCADIARSCGAYFHADISHTATFVAAGLHPPAFPFCDFATFNMSKNLRGPNSGVLIYRNNLEKKVSEAIFPKTQGGANETNLLGKFAALLEWDNESIVDYATRIVHCAKVLGCVFQKRGIELVTGGTDCHILLVRLSENSGSGSEIEKQLETIGILANKNLVPGDKRSPAQTSGIRFGTANLAILNYTDTDIQDLGNLIADVIEGNDVDKKLVKHLTTKYPSPFS